MNRSFMEKRVLLDFHSHILPGMDDGAQYPQESLAMLIEEAKADITDVCLSPHFYADENSITSFLKRRQHSYSLLCAEKKNRKERLPNLYLSAEVHYFAGMAEEPLLDLLCCGASNLILIEPPMRKWDKSFYSELNRIRDKRKLQPVIAHLDRYLSILDDFSLVTKIRNNGYWIQCNAEFFLSREYRSVACDLLHGGEIAFLGSDAHNMSSRPVEMKSLLKLLKKERLAERFFALSSKGLDHIIGHS